MTDVFRYHITRASERLSPCQIKTVGIQIYPDGHSSELVINLKRLCQEGRREEYINLLQTYLNGKDFIYDIKQIYPHLAKAYEWINCRKKWNAQEFETKFYLENSKDGEALLSNLKNDWIKIADTLLATSALGVAGQPQLINYQKLLKTVYLVDMVHQRTEKRRRLSDAQLEKILKYYSVILPDGVISFRCCNDPLEREVSGVNLNNSRVLSRFMKIPEDTGNSGTNNTHNDHPDKECECGCNTDCAEPSNHCICIKPFVSDLLVVKEDLTCYKPGEIAYIENILLGEIRKREHRDFTKTDEYTEKETTVSKTEEKDHQVTDRFSLQSNSDSVIKSDTNIDTGITITGKYGKNIHFESNLDVSASFSKETSQRTSTSYARDIVDRTIMKIQETVRELISKRIIHKVEEKNTHQFKNDSLTKFGDNISGIYFWVNMFTKAQVMSYGKRMMFELIIPEPSAMYKYLINKNKFIEDKPEIDLNSIISGPSEITRENYLIKFSDNAFKKLVIEELLPPPPEYIYVTSSIAGKEDPASKWAVPMIFKVDDLIIPEGYVSESFSLHASSFLNEYQKDTFNNAGTSKQVLVSIGRESWQNYSESGSMVNHGMDPLSGRIPAVINVWGSNSVAVSISIKCILKIEVYEKWQLAQYNKFKNAVMQYNQNITNENNKNKNLRPSFENAKNPFLNREIERKELKRHSIAMLMCDYFTEFDAMQERVKSCGFPQMDFKEAEKEGKIINFFEQAFEWNLMNYLFYPDIWARKCKWSSLIDISSGDPLFDKFLMCGAAKIQLPVRPEFEEFVNWFLATGEIWGHDGVPPVPGDAHYVSIIQEIKEQKQCLYTNRDGFLNINNSDAFVVLNNSGYYWDYLNNQPDQLLIDNDIDREIVIDCVVYRIVEIDQVGANHEKWKITLDRPYEGITTPNIKFQVGALFIGAPWEVKIPTNLVYLRNKKDCLPCYPLPKCESNN